MPASLLKLWIEIRSSLWFVPCVLVLGSIILAIGLVQIDLAFHTRLQGQSWQPYLNAGADGARGMLTAIASSMITVAGVAFSITIVSLSLASTQYTPRILRNFMRDRGNQVVLGVFLAIFTYCLVVLRTIRAGDEADGGGFVPLLSVAMGLLLALLAIGCLIYFIHHVAASIQASSILASITRETFSVIDSLFPEKIGEENPASLANTFDESAVTWATVSAAGFGYLQHVSPDGLLRYAVERNVIVRLECQPGDFITEGAALASVSCTPGESDVASLRSQFVVGEFRTVDQDPGFGLRQIVDIALKALSPGINDSNTAVSCLDYLGAIVLRLGERHFPHQQRWQEGRLRVIAPAPDFAEHLALALDEIRRAASTNVTILLHLIRLLCRLAGGISAEDRRTAILQHARLVAQAAATVAPDPAARRRLQDGIQRLRARLGVTPVELPDLL